MEITVRYYGPDRTDGLQAYDLRVVVTNAVDMPTEVFVWQRKVPSTTDPQADALGDVFTSVADPVDLEQYPVGSPVLSENIPYYRTDNITLRFRSIEELEDVRDRIAQDLTGLVEALKIASTLVVMEEVTYA
jgi:hypothetical protein